MGNLLASSPLKDVLYDQWLETIPSLEGKSVAITGSTSGTGYWTAVCAVRKNATLLILLNRSSARVDASIKNLTKEKEIYGSKTVIIPVECDLMSFSSVRKAAEEVNSLVEKHGGLNILVNNAGINGPDMRTEDGFDIQMQVNHLSHFLLTKLLFPSFEAALENHTEVRISQHSSGFRNFFGGKLQKKDFQRSPPGTLGGDTLYQMLFRYHKTKLANSTFAMKLDKELKDHGYDTSKIKSVAADPGVSGTDFGKNFFELSKDAGIIYKIQSTFFAAFLKFGPQQSAADGALPLIESCFANEVKSGDYFYPVTTLTGVPFKGISENKAVPKGKGGDEKPTLSEENQTALWEASEEAIGMKFFDTKTQI